MLLDGDRSVGMLTVVSALLLWLRVADRGHGGFVVADEDRGDGFVLSFGGSS